LLRASGAGIGYYELIYSGQMSYEASSPAFQFALVYVVSVDSVLVIASTILLAVLCLSVSVSAL